MNFDDAISLLVAVATAAYLIYALLFPEHFS